MTAPTIMDEAHGKDWSLKPCQTWTGALTAGGYGARRENGVVVFVHRSEYERQVGPIPEGLELDHLCRNRACFEPTHLEPVTHRVNSIRSESPTMQAHRAGTCVNGHPASDAYRRPSGPRAGQVVYCRTCKRERAAA